MAKQKITVLLLFPLMTSLVCSNVQAYPQNNHDSFVAGACAVGAALVGVAGATALINWCCSETDDQLIARVEREYRSIRSQYQQTMDYFGPRAGVGIHAPHLPIHAISESVIYEFATHVWNSGISHTKYRSDVWSAKNSLQSCTKDLRKRIYAIQDKGAAYEKRTELVSMRSVLSDCERLLGDISLLADCLEYHKTYFTLYDSVGTIYNRYLGQITILESGSYYAASEVKRYILNHDSSQYAFKNFVKNIESDIAILKSDVYALAHNYDAGQRYAYKLIDQLVTIKNIVVSDPRYQQELYQWEQERLEYQRMQAAQEQARLERDRIHVLQQQNRILEEQNRLERQKLYAQSVVMPTPVFDEVSVTISF